MNAFTNILLHCFSFIRVFSICIVFNALLEFLQFFNKHIIVLMFQHCFLIYIKLVQSKGISIAGGHYFKLRNSIKPP